MSPPLGRAGILRAGERASVIFTQKVQTEIGAPQLATVVSKAGSFVADAVLRILMSIEGNALLARSEIDISALIELGGLIQQSGVRTGKSVSVEVQSDLIAAFIEYQSSSVANLKAAGRNPSAEYEAAYTSSFAAKNFAGGLAASGFTSRKFGKNARLSFIDKVGQAAGTDAAIGLGQKSLIAISQKYASDLALREALREAIVAERLDDIISSRADLDHKLLKDVANKLFSLLEPLTGKELAAVVETVDADAAKEVDDVSEAIVAAKSPAEVKQIVSSSSTTPESSNDTNVKASNPPVLSSLSTQNYVATVLIAPLQIENTGAVATSCSVSPDLPPGLVIATHQGSCRISGIPTSASATTTYSVAATAADGAVGSSSLTISIVPANPPVLSNAVAQNFVRTVPIPDVIFTNTGAAAVSCYASPTLPSGLTLGLHNESCRIAGTPSSIANNTYTITATGTDGSKGNATVPIAIVASNPPAFTDPTDRYFVTTVTISPIDITNEGSSVVSCEISPALPDGLLLTPNGHSCRVSGTPTANSPTSLYSLTGTAADGSQDIATFNMQVAAANPPNLANAANQSFLKDQTITPVSFANSGAPAASCVVAPALPDGLSVETNTNTCRITGTPTGTSSSSTYTVTAHSSDGSSDTATIVIEVNSAPIGTLDPTFATSGYAKTGFVSSAWRSQGNAMAIQADGKIIVVGKTTDYNTYTRLAIARYNTNGTLDTSFSDDGKHDMTVFVPDDWDNPMNYMESTYMEGNAIKILPDGSILVGGTMKDYYDTPMGFVARFSSSGAPDSGGVSMLRPHITHGVTSLAVQSDGKMVVGAIYLYSGSNRNFIVARLSASGELDNSFNGTGYVSISLGRDSLLRDIAVTSGGKIVAVGMAEQADNTGRFGTVVLNSNGSFDTSFNSTGQLLTTGGSVAWALTIDSSGRYNLAGSGGITLARYNTDGTLDTSFDTDGKVTGGIIARSISILDNGKIMICGGNGSGMTTVRYNSNGSIDTTYGSGGSLTFTVPADNENIGMGNYSTNTCAAMAIQSDGKIVLAGDTYSDTGDDQKFTVMRILP